MTWDSSHRSNRGITSTTQKPLKKSSPWCSRPSTITLRKAQSHLVVLHELLRTVFNAQSAIGWDLFLRGYLCPQWQLIPCSSPHWRTQLLTHIYTGIHSLLVKHNDLYHATTLQRWERDKHKRLSTIITMLHDLRPKALSCDQHILVESATACRSAAMP